MLENSTPSEEQPTTETPTEEQPVAETSTEKQPAAETPTEEQPAVEASAKEQPAAEMSAEVQPRVDMMIARYSGDGEGVVDIGVVLPLVAPRKDSYQQSDVNVQLNGPQRRALRSLVNGLMHVGARLGTGSIAEKGSLVTTGHAAVLYVLDKIAPCVPPEEG